MFHYRSQAQQVFIKPKLFCFESYTGATPLKVTLIVVHQYAFIKFKYKIKVTVC